MDIRIIGTHNSMTYLRPRNWWMRVVEKWAKCQDRDLQEQMEVGNCFDLRVFYKRGKWNFAHGLCEYTSRDIFEVLNELKEHAGNKALFVRIILEKGDDMSTAFTGLCKQLEDTYPTINFFGGNRKSDWAKLYTFKCDFLDTDVHQFVSSMMGVSKLTTPRSYAKEHNQENYTKAGSGVNLYDFLGDY